MHVDCFCDLVRLSEQCLHPSESIIDDSVISVRIFPLSLSLSFLVFRFFRSVTVIVNENGDFSVTVTVRGLFRYVFVTVIVRGRFFLARS